MDAMLIKEISTSPVAWGVSAATSAAMIGITAGAIVNHSSDKSIDKETYSMQKQARKEKESNHRSTNLKVAGAIALTGLGGAGLGAVVNRVH